MDDMQSSTHRWCAGANVVSPMWLERSLSLGYQEKCLHISLDTWKQLPQEARSTQHHGSQADSALAVVSVKMERDSTWPEAQQCMPRSVFVFLRKSSFSSLPMTEA
jgi:hypothetical protein